MRLGGFTYLWLYYHFYRWITRFFQSLHLFYFFHIYSIYGGKENPLLSQLNLQRQPIDITWIIFRASWRAAEYSLYLVCHCGKLTKRRFFQRYGNRGEMLSLFEYLPKLIAQLALILLDGKVKHIKFQMDAKVLATLYNQ